MYEWIGKITGNPLITERIGKLCGRVPRPLMLLLCKAVGTLLFCFAGRKLRSTVLHNLHDLLPERSGKQKKTYRLQYFQNAAITVYEILFDSVHLESSQSWRFHIKGGHHLDEALKLGRGAIIYTPHEGNFFYYYWYLCRQYKCLTIATGGSAELRPLYLLFEAMGCPGLDYDNTPPLELLRKLRKHLSANGVVFLLGDFWRPSFPESKFFGKITRTPEGAAALSIEQQVPVVPFYGRRYAGFKHELIFEQPLHLYASFSRTQRADATLLLNRFMERVIREHPAQWFYWFNAEERWEENRYAIEVETTESGLTKTMQENNQSRSFPA